ncbi:MAG: hypothetical protein KDD58_01045 [Bdellovibrionales bacterium]|nr:hypothetical protein [Bdellovibrionales bacterium]
MKNIFISILVLYPSINSLALEEPEEPKAQEAFIANEWRFDGEYGKFTIKKIEDKYAIDNREINPDIFKDFEQIFRAETTYDVDCPHDLGNKPTIKITAHNDTTSITRDFFVEKSYIRDNTTQKCLYILKEGLTRLPLHKDWFIGQTNATLNIHNKLQIYTNGKLLFDFEKENNEWYQKNSELFIDWEYFHRVLDSFRDFPIEKRYHIALANEKPNFEIRTGREVYHFYLVGRNYWAIKLPKVKWLIGSSAWALLEDFNPKLWLSRYNELLVVLTNKDKNYTERSAALNKIGSSWTPSIKQAFHQVILDPDDSDQLKAHITSHLKRKPTNENMKILVKALEQTEDIDLKTEITKVLKIMNPRGPVIQSDKPEKIDEYILQWKSWANTLK